MEAVEGVLTSVVLWLRLGAEAISTVLVGIGIVIGTYRLVRLGEVPTRTNYLRVRLTIARFLVLALEFQLAADIMATAVSPSWEQLGKLGIVAVIRTFLAFFVEREMKGSEAELQDAEKGQSSTNGD